MTVNKGVEVGAGWFGPGPHVDKPLGDDGLYEAAADLVERSRVVVAHVANAVLVAANWRLGHLIDTEILHRGRAEYGKQILATLSQRLTARFGSGFDPTNLNRMVNFSRGWSPQILATLSQELSWSHVRELIPLKTDEARAFYAAEVAAKHLGVRDLREAIGRKAYERREIANSRIPQGSAVPLDVFRDPMLLDRLGLADSFQERDLEAAILRDLESFLLEFGHGLAFIGRQVRMGIEDKDVYLDLLFYSRPQRRLVAIELKIGAFEAAHMGQMRLYLKWLDRYERQEGEAAPIGLILCTEANRAEVELLDMEGDGIAVAEYWAALPPKGELTARIQMMLRDARERLARREQTPIAELRGPLDPAVEGGEP
ncbi:MAG: PDDEXK nuclease domain-containing protein [Frankiaceae bacterium]|jgi:predicted nuclease of restriction endonuclease-like (RecB) superfamily|nr:PDDEXK nuclease domain-containing protein [Frankiaceae bacterium]